MTEASSFRKQLKQCQQNREKEEKRRRRRRRRRRRGDGTKYFDLKEELAWNGKVQHEK
jgi:hypothetical protein